MVIGASAVVGDVERVVVDDGIMPVVAVVFDCGRLGSG